MVLSWFRFRGEDWTAPRSPATVKLGASMVRARLLAGCALLLALGGVATAGGASAATPGPLPDLNQIDPVKYTYSDAIVDFAQVKTRTTAGTDQIWVDYIRPKTADKVPTIMVASPYFNTLGRGYRSELKTPHFGPSFPTSPGFPFLGPSTLTGANITPFPEWYDEYFVPRGYAVLLMDLRGTRNSSGCEVYGDRSEVTDAVDVIDWIADQPWSNGKVAMTGGSYDGTIAIGAAAEEPLSGRHKSALAAIIPIRGIDAWYEYHFFNGVQSGAHRLTAAEFTGVFPAGDTQNAGTDDLLLPLHVIERKACIPTLGLAVDLGYSSPYQDADAPFWAGRDFVKDAAGFRAATLIMHGLFDFNVKTLNSGNLWAALPANLPKRLMYFNGDHADPDAPTEQDEINAGHLVPFPFRNHYRDATHRWFLQFLKGVDSGALRQPKVEIQREDGTFDPVGVFPAPSTDQVLYFGDGKAGDGAPASGTVTWDDSVLGNMAPKSQVFTTPPFAKPTRISGQLQFDLTYSLGGPDTSIGIEIDDIPPGPAATAPTYDLYDGKDKGPFVMSYGWLRPYYRDSIKARGHSVPSHGSFLTPGQKATTSFPSLYTDYIVRPGHRLRFTFANAAGAASGVATVPAQTGNVVTMYLGTGASKVRVPIAESALAASTPAPTPTGAPSPSGLPNTGLASPAAACGAVALLLIAAGLLPRRRRRSG